MKYLFSTIFIALFILTIFQTGCKDTVSGVNIDQIVVPDSNVSYSQYIQPIFNIHCISCHGNGELDAGLDLTTWAGTTADPRIVFPGQPENSVLVWTIEGNPAVSPMPPQNSGFAPLNENQFNGIKVWIKEGAKSN